MKKIISLSLLVMLFAVSSAFAAKSKSGHMGGKMMDGQTMMQDGKMMVMKHGKMVDMASCPEVTRDYIKAMDTMHEPMMEGIMDENPDAAFVRGMIPHHEGAIEMAKIQLKHGKDPELRKLAEAIIKAQKEEITFMRIWLQNQK